MSNPYPPTPSFGGSYFRYPDNLTMPQDGRSHGVLGAAPPLQQGWNNSIPTPTNAAPAMNTQSFQANAMFPNHTPSVPPSIPPPPPPFQVAPEFFKQFSSSTLPPPPYPPVPIPHVGFPHFPPPPPNFAATSTPPSNTITNTLQPHQRATPPISSIPPAGDYSQTSNTVPREEGELSDGELDGASADSGGDPSQPIRTKSVSITLIPQRPDFSSQGASFLGAFVTSQAYADGPTDNRLPYSSTKIF
jgi:hypothetical protein